MHPVEQIVNAPLEIVLDNFTEVEHAATVHKFIGYSIGDMHRVRSVVATTQDSVRVDNSGPQKFVPKLIRWMFGIPGGAEFHWEWVTRFSPVHTTYDEFWTLPESSEPLGVRGRIHVFFCPIDNQQTRLIVFPMFKLPWSKPITNFCLMFRELARQMVKFEIAQDARMLDQLADTNVDLQGMKLSRLDRPLALHRERIASIYRQSNVPTPTCIADKFISQQTQ